MLDSGGVQATNASIPLPLVARRQKSNLQGGKDCGKKKIDEALACLDRAKPDAGRFTNVTGSGLIVAHGPFDFVASLDGTIRYSGK